MLLVWREGGRRRVGQIYLWLKSPKPNVNFQCEFYVTRLKT